MRMAARAEPPMPTRLPKADITTISGRLTPRAAMDWVPCWPGRFPMYIRSTILYSALITWAAMAGTASLSIRRPIPSFPRSVDFGKSSSPKAWLSISPSSAPLPAALLFSGLPTGRERDSVGCAGINGDSLLRRRRSLIQRPQKIPHPALETHETVAPRSLVKGGWNLVYSTSGGI